MTESSSHLTTHPLAVQHPVTAAPSLASPLPNGSTSDTNNQEEEEEYTIKCICVYTDDDGNTVYCPKCDTWQHIECYYHGKKVPEDHFCADCSPRDLDAKKATERQRRHREALEGGDRKPKRPASSKSKKKHKDSISGTGEHPNGYDSRHESVGAREGPPAKKPKINHKTSASVVSMNGDSRKRASSNLQSYPSPSKSPQDLFRFPTIPQYTTEFLELYERDEGNTQARGNAQTIQAANHLSGWRTDSSLFCAPGGQPSMKTPLVRAKQPFDQIEWPQVSVETMRKTDVEADGRHPMWRFLRLQSAVRKDDFVGEIRGEVGMLEEYCQQKSSSNRWHELSHPDPFVFFHPHMNIYIDSRKSGTKFRYLRRSCKPNVTLKSFVSDDGEIRHCFVASKDILPGAELTAAWFLNPSMFNLDPNRQDTEEAQHRRLDWVSCVLANFGDCACDGGACLWASSDRRLPARAEPGGPKDKAGRKKKSKKQAISPLSTGQATNSRAGSEAKAQEDEDPFDRRSTSESTRSGVHSRDITPVNVAALDADPVLGSGLTARELRKIQMAEKAFAAKEQEKRDGAGQGQQKKKKRTSGGSTLNTPNASTNKQFGHAPPSYPTTPIVPQSGTKSTDPSPPPSKRLTTGQMMVNQRHRSRSRVTVTPPRPVYVDVSVQTDPEEDETPMQLPKRRKFCTPTQRLLRKLLADRCNADQVPKVSISPTSVTTVTLNSATESCPGPTPVVDDVEMRDAGADDSDETPSATMATVDESNSNVGTSTYPLPSQAAHTHKSFKPPGEQPRLYLSTLPPVPAFALARTPNSAATTATTTPALTSAATAHSPVQMFAGTSPLPHLPPASAVVTPSPARKKLSLGDYMSRRAASTPSIEKSQSQMEGDQGEQQSRSSPARSDSSTQHLRPNDSLAQTAAAQGGLSGSAIDDNPTKDSEDEPEYNPPDVTPMEVESKQFAGTTSPSVTSAVPAAGVSPELSNVLAQLAELKGKAA